MDVSENDQRLFKFRLSRTIFYACKLYALLVSFDGWEKGQVVVGVCSYWEKIRFVKCHGGQMRRKGHK